MKRQTLEQFAGPYWKTIAPQIPYHKRREMLIDAVMLMWNVHPHLPLSVVEKRIDVMLAK